VVKNLSLGTLGNSIAGIIGGHRWWGRGRYRDYQKHGPVSPEVVWAAVHWWLSLAWLESSSPTNPN